MIQRVQSIYLFLVSISAVLMLFLPVAIVDAKMVSGLSYAPFAVICGWVCVHALGSIFQFKKRKTQMKLVWALMFIELVGLILPFLVPMFLGGQAHWLAYIAPVFWLLLTFLAWRGIHKDEALVKSMDRLR